MKNPSYWRMQLHPFDRQYAASHAIQSLAAGFIGLDFKREVGDLHRTNKSDLPSHQRDYYPFAHDMRIGDFVLVISHHFPFALVKVAGPYNYIRNPVPEIGVWFRHFRRVKDIRYY